VLRSLFSATDTKVYFPASDDGPPFLPLNGLSRGAFFLESFEPGSFFDSCEVVFLGLFLPYFWDEALGFMWRNVKSSLPFWSRESTSVVGEDPPNVTVVSTSP